MENYRLILLPGETQDLTGCAITLALQLASRDAQVTLIDLRTGPGERPFDPAELPPRAWSKQTSDDRPLPEDWPDLLHEPAGWLISGLENRQACLQAFDQHPGHRLHDASGWFDPERSLPEATGEAGSIELGEIHWPARLRLTGLIRCSCESPSCGAQEQIARGQLEPILRALPVETELELDACSFFTEDGMALARWLRETAPTLRWRLRCGVDLNAEQAAQLPALGCVGLTLLTPTPAAQVFAAQAPAADPQRLAAQVRQLADALPLDLIYQVGAPQDTPQTQHAAIRQLRAMQPALRSFRARPLAPQNERRFRERIEPGVDWAARGPHGWSCGHVNHSWRAKLAREYQLVAEALGLTLSQRLPLAREFVRYSEQIVRRLLSSPASSLPFVEQHLPLVGVLQGQRALRGPRMLEIDLTNDCNNTCVGCWCHSLMMGADRFSGQKKKQFLATEVLLELLDDAAASGTQAVQLAGSGEPFMHPDIIDVLTHAKQLGLEVTVVTNVNFITRDWADKLIESGVDYITASVWAGTPEMYVRTHPNQTQKSFERIREVLTYLSQRKRALGKQHPQVKMYHVISQINCREIAPMVDFAVETGCEQVEFTLTDIVAGKSDCLALSPLDRAAVLLQFKELSLRAVDPTRTAARGTAVYDALDQGTEVKQFGKFEQDTHSDFSWGDSLLETMICPAGCEGSLPVDNFCDKTETRYHYFWSVWDCHRCERFEGCPIDKTHLALTKQFTELTGFGSFYRRLQSQQAGPAGGVQYETALVDKIPCTVGWTYSRVRVSGDVIPCCKGHDHPLGSLHEQSFSSIWFGPTLDEFRKLARSEKKSHPYFARIDCYKACDNIGMNLDTARALEALSPDEREQLEQAAQDV